MRWAKSYGIVDHELLHGKHLHRLSHVGMCLYLFLAVVSDINGKSFYGLPTIMDILRLSSVQLEQAIHELVDFKLLDYRYPHFFLLNLESSYDKQSHKPDPVSQRCAKTLIQTDSQRTRHIPPQSLQPVFRDLLSKIDKRFPP